MKPWPAVSVTVQASDPEPRTCPGRTVPMTENAVKTPDEPVDRADTAYACDSRVEWLDDEQVWRLARAHGDLWIVDAHPGGGWRVGTRAAPADAARDDAKYAEWLESLPVFDNLDDAIASVLGGPQVGGV